MNIRALVVDDEPRARSRLRRLLDGHADVVVVGEASTGEEAIQQVLALRPDVVFLDINMPGLLGTEAAGRLRSYLPETVRPAIVFTTAHAEHAVAAFEVESLDYLLKPVERDRLAEALRRLRRSLWAQPGQPVAPVSPPPTATVTGRHGSAIEAVPVGSIVSVEVEDGEAFAFTTDGDKTRLGEGLADIEARLPSPPFVRISRGALVNTERVDRMRPKDSGTWEIQLDDGRKLNVSRRRAKHVRALIGV